MARNGRNIYHVKVCTGLEDGPVLVQKQQELAVVLIKPQVRVLLAHFA